MNGKMIAIITTIASIIILGVSLAFGARRRRTARNSAIGISNEEIELRNQAVAQQKANEATFDKVWKVLKQKAGIMDKQREDFRAVYTGIMNERYQGEANGAPAFKWIKEHNPEFPMDMYKDISNAIESNRATFLRVQKRLIDIKREHDNIRKKFPSSLIVGSRPELDIQIVTSKRTKRTFETGEENEEDLEL